ncbi:MAG: peptidylprolyl isomerase [Alphaproteobacteria bacterium]|nr:peptidylprolyl isomerase [Alphaproteobacteria bacterium]
MAFSPRSPLRRLALALGLGLTLSAGGDGAAAQSLDPENTLILTLESGAVTIAMRPDLAPNHVERIKTLAREGFYDGVVFHRVIDGFMAQTGDPTGAGTGGSSYPDLQAEFSDASHVRGTVSMARTPDPNSANSQFFIVFERAPHLDGQYTVWGEVVDGMELVDDLKRGAPGSGMVRDPDQIVTMRVMADVQ